MEIPPLYDTDVAPGQRCRMTSQYHNSYVIYLLHPWFILYELRHALRAIELSSKYDIVALLCVFYNGTTIINPLRVVDNRGGHIRMLYVACVLKLNETYIFSLALDKMLFHI